jgi:hypothetical protein
MDGYKTLKAGQAVSFETIGGDKGLHATNITANDDANIEKESVEGELNLADSTVTHNDVHLETV